ncbi:hypothetical protein JCM30760_26820 [Thiomicrorhabdus hydrogeniphila]
MSNTKEMQRLPLIPKELHTEFKKLCVEKGFHMKTAAEAAIKDWIQKNKEKENSQEE